MGFSLTLEFANTEANEDASVQRDSSIPKDKERPESFSAKVAKARLSDDIVIAKIISVSRKKGMKRLKSRDHYYCTVDYGGEHTVGVVCGGKNIQLSENKFVAFAPINSEMPNGNIISRKKLGRAYSDGNICSAAELELGLNREDVLTFDGDVKTGMPLSSVKGYFRNCSTVVYKEPFYYQICVIFKNVVGYACGYFFNKISRIISQDGGVFIL